MKVTLTRFRLNRKGIAAIAVSRQVKAAVHDEAENAKLYAVAISPRSRRRHQHYADSFQIEDELMHGFPPQWPMTRAVSRLANTSPQSIAVEVGTARVDEQGRTITTPAHRVLEQTLEYLSAVAKVT